MKLLKMNTFGSLWLNLKKATEQKTSQASSLWNNRQAFKRCSNIVATCDKLKSVKKLNKQSVYVNTACKIRLHMNLTWNHLAEICCYSPRHQCSDTERVFKSEVPSSGKDIFHLCSMRQCMREVWLSATGLWRANQAERHAETTAKFQYLLLFWAENTKRSVLE